MEPPGKSVLYSSVLKGNTYRYRMIDAFALKFRMINVNTFDRSALSVQECALPLRPKRGGAPDPFGSSRVLSTKGLIYLVGFDFRQVVRMSN